MLTIHDYQHDHDQPARNYKPLTMLLGAILQPRLRLLH
jgi:hypothetical protein